MFADEASTSNRAKVSREQLNFDVKRKRDAALEAVWNESRPFYLGKFGTSKVLATLKLGKYNLLYERFKYIQLVYLNSVIYIKRIEHLYILFNLKFKINSKFFI